MQAEMEAMVLAGELAPEDLSSCCNDMQTWGETGQLCKTALDYPGLVAWAPAPATLAVGAAPTADPPRALTSAEPQAPPSALWRPPTAR